MIRGIHYYLKAYSALPFNILHTDKIQYYIKKNLGERRGVGSCAGCFFRTATGTGCYFGTATGTGCFFGTATGTGCFFGTATGTGCFFGTVTGTGCFFRTATETGASSLLLFTCFFICLSSSRLLVSSIASPLLVFSNLSHGFCLACHNISIACDLCMGGEAMSDGND